MKLRDRIRKEDFDSKIIYSDGKIISSKYYYDGKVFNTRKAMSEYYIQKTFGKLQSQKPQTPKEDAFSF